MDRGSVASPGSERYDSLEQVSRDSGGRAFNSAKILGTLFNAGLVNAYYPAKNRTVGGTFQRFGIRLAVGAGTNVLQEFVPEIVLLIGIGPIAANARSHGGSTATPIQHLVIIFQENVSFDHYFGAYPNATNPPNEPPFYARRGTPTVNGFTPALLNNNPNLNPLNGNGATETGLSRDGRPGSRLPGRATGI